MWPFFSREVSKEFPYEIGDQLHSLESSCFSIHKGFTKPGKDLVSIFTYDKKRGNNEQYEYAKSTLKRLKTLRHPSIVTYLDSQENESNLLIVTEYVEPLLYYLNDVESSSARNQYIAWGIMSVMNAVSFLNNSAKLKHNNLFHGSVFVNSAGEWKLGEVGYASDSLSYPRKFSSSLSKYDPPEKNKREDNSSPFWAHDSWGLGVVMWEVFNGSLSEARGLSNLTSIPRIMQPIYSGLVSPDPHRRPNVADVLQNGRKSKGIFDNELVETFIFLDEIHIKNKEEMNLFFKNIIPLLGKIPKCTGQYKILPALIKAFEYGCDGACVVQPFLEISKSIEPTKYSRDAVPFLTKLFTCNDRATRMTLLQNIELYIDKVSDSVVNENLFPHIVNGFLDTNRLIREQTVKSIIHIAPKLNNKNLNEELLRHFARLQAKDEQGSIRTNTTVCLGKIAHCLNPQNRKTVLMSAYLRALNDSFPPVRNAGILALAVSQQYFTLEDIGKKILPSLCHLTLDPDEGVREITFRTIKGFLGKLEKVSENPHLKQEMDEGVMSTRQPVASWAEWAVTALASKFSKVAESRPEEHGRKSEIGSMTVNEPEPLRKDSVEEKVSSWEENIEAPSLSDDNEDFDWNEDSWKPIEVEEPPVVEVKPQIKPKMERKPLKERQREKTKTGPMKLGTKITQAKFE